MLPDLCSWEVLECVCPAVSLLPALALRPLPSPKWQQLGNPHRAWVPPGAHSEEVKAWPGSKMLELGACDLTDLVLLLLGCAVGR